MPLSGSIQNAPSAEKPPVSTAARSFSETVYTRERFWVDIFNSSPKVSLSRLCGDALGAPPGMPTT